MKFNKFKRNFDKERSSFHDQLSFDIIERVDAAMSSGILKAKQKLGVTFNSDHLKVR